MVQLAQQYNVHEMPESGFLVAPEGDYFAIIKATEAKPTKDGQGTFIETKVQLIEHPQYAGHTIIDRINYINNSAEAVRIAEGTMRAISEACNVQVLSATEQWHGIPIIVTVGIEPASGQFQARNSILAYKPSGAPVAPPQQMTPPAGVAPQPTAVQPGYPQAPVQPGTPQPPAGTAPVQGAAPPMSAPTTPAAVAPVAPAQPAAPPVPGTAPVPQAPVDPNAPPF